MALLIKEPWDRAHQQLHVVVELLVAEGPTVALFGRAGQQPVRYRWRASVTDTTEVESVHRQVSRQPAGTAQSRREAAPGVGAQR